ncbi:cell division and transport-associated protein TolA [Rhodobacter aestuarii]|uniref:Cell division and transport-associated protein TolA n=1 Tax=Rhodobacter aestuarii TaxID=453582 RepID=A0A1N7Q5N6_9RHOB|nr:hypothetical protein [Rhodobacter aestuarii]PTV93871.1 cell division and transport-associated protein TolA [Rhodobacter aestuarii]SIT18178.1 Cell division and transport-associated protein TolA [Rhodobacter aestuarii]
MRMDRAERIGTGVSAALHIAVIVWAIIGTSLFKPKPTEPVEIKPAGMISEAEFAALQAAAPKPGEAAPAQPEEPAVAEPAPEVPSPEAAPETPPTPEPPPAPEAEPMPDMTDLTDPTPPTEVTEVPPSMMPPVEEPQDTEAPEFSPRPRPKPASRVAPIPSEAPEPDARVSPTAVAETRPDPEAEPEAVQEEPTEEAAPPEATTEIVTEATETEDRATTSAPRTSPRPRAKPPVPRPAPVQTAQPAQPARPAPAVPADAVADALAEAMGDDRGAEDSPGGLGIAANGPPVTAGEKEALVVDVKQCWNVGALSSEALRTSVTVRVDMEQNARPIIGSIRMVGYEGGSEAAANQAYEAARRAIIRCGSDGFPLPAEKYGWWQQIEIVFDPSKMRMK